ncbi:MAG: autotransporter outer membrane beta-barrel domain-containing protein [Pseudomonadota bacterium]
MRRFLSGCVAAAIAALTANFDTPAIAQTSPTSPSPGCTAANGGSFNQTVPANGNGTTISRTENFLAGEVLIFTLAGDIRNSLGVANGNTIYSGPQAPGSRTFTIPGGAGFLPIVVQTDVQAGPMGTATISLRCTPLTSSTQSTTTNTPTTGVPDGYEESVYIGGVEGWDPIRQIPLDIYDLPFLGGGVAPEGSLQADLARDFLLIGESVADLREQLNAAIAAGRRFGYADGQLSRIQRAQRILNDFEQTVNGALTDDSWEDIRDIVIEEFKEFNEVLKEFNVKQVPVPSPGPQPAGTDGETADQSGFDGPRVIRTFYRPDEKITSRLNGNGNSAIDTILGRNFEELPVFNLDAPGRIFPVPAFGPGAVAQFFSSIYGQQGLGDVRGASFGGRAGLQIALRNGLSGGGYISAFGGERRINSIAFRNRQTGFGIGLFGRYRLSRNTSFTSLIDYQRMANAVTQGGVTGSFNSSAISGQFGVQNGFVTNGVRIGTSVNLGFLHSNVAGHTLSNASVVPQMSRTSLTAAAKVRAEKATALRFGDGRWGVTPYLELGANFNSSARDVVSAGVRRVRASKLTGTVEVGTRFNSIGGAGVDLSVGLNGLGSSAYGIMGNFALNIPFN